MTAAARFRAAVEAHDVEAAIGLLHPDVEFRSPVVHTPYRGADRVGRLLRHVFEVFDDFRYVDQLDGATTSGLVFRARVGTREVEGWVYITGEGEQITQLVVMVRPLSGLVALAEAMGARLAADDQG